MNNKIKKAPTIEEYRKSFSEKLNEYIRQVGLKSSPKNQPLVSIVTVVFDGENTLQVAIDSVKRLSYKKIEYIIIDGGSTDGTIQIIKENEKDISFWISEKDGGIYDAMNKGVSLANGELIGLLNADDYYEPDAVENVVNCYNSMRGDIFHGDVNYIKDGKRLFTLKPSVKLKKSSFIEMPVNHPATFVQRQLYQELGVYRTDFKIAADWEFILRAFIKKKRFTYVPKVLTNYSLEGISTTQATIGIREIFSTLAEIKFLSPISLQYYYNVAKIKLHLKNSNNRLFKICLNAVRKMKSRTVN